MKQVLISLLVVLSMITFTTNAQEKGEMSVGGNVTLGVTSLGSDYSDTELTFSVAPEFGYFVAKNVKVGLQLEYSINSLLSDFPPLPTSLSNVYSKNVTTHSFAVMPNFSYYVRLVDKFYYVPGLAIGGGFADYNGDTELEGFFGLSLNLCALEYKPIPNLGISASLLSFSFATTGHLNTFGFSLLSAPTVGFSYYF